MRILRFGTMLLLAAPFFIVSCKKKDTTPAVSIAPIHRQIVSVVDSEVTIYTSPASQEKRVFIWTFSYNTDSTVSKVTFKRRNEYPKPYQDSVVTNYAYFSGFFVQTDGIHIDTVRLDSAGNIIRSSGSFYFYTLHTNQIQSINSVEPQYFWNDDNIAFFVSMDTTFYEYYTDKEMRPGDGIQIRDFMRFGRPLFRNKKLIKSLTNDFVAYPSKTTYNYQFDGFDRITEMTSEQSTESNTVKSFYKFGY